jgi:alpha-L-fucosidase 2
VRWYLQEAALGLKYAAVAGSRKRGDGLEIALTVASTKDGPDPVAAGRKRVADALAAGYEALLKSHAEWWQRFWSRSGIRVPDAAVQHHYDLVQYFYGAASRRGAPPMPLQGVWTADAGGLPPWKGDYHHDLNTQFTYYAYQAAGRFDQGACFLDFMWGHLPAHRKFARRFYGTGGAAVPGVMTLDGKAMGGWGQYSLSPTMGAWVAHLFYLHWRYTMDREFLAERAYPYCSAIAECLCGLLKAGPDGKLKLPLSTSPEIHNNSLRAWLTPNTNNDLALLKCLFTSLREMAGALGEKAGAARWQGVLGRLDDLAVEGETGALKLARDESLRQSHRHHAHLMAVHPLGVLHVEGADRDRKIIDASLEHTAKLGTRAWCGYSFSWMACMLARCGRGEEAGRQLAIYLEAFLSRNGFHINGDQSGKGYSNFRYRPFTLEGNFAASQAVHEMLLQSWGGVVRVFPAVPPKWRDVSFTDLRAEGGYRVSAERKGGRTVRVRITAGAGGRLRLRDPFGGAAAKWSRAVKKAGRDYECTLRAGEALAGRLAAGGQGS